MTTDLEPTTHPGLDPDDWANKFLENLTSPDCYGILSRAATRTGIAPRTIETRLQDDLVFKTHYEEALNHVKDTVRHEIMRRAVEPGHRPIYNRGELVGHAEEWDNRHLQWVAERLMPDEFHLATRVELVTGKEGENTFTFKMGEEELPETKPDEK